MPHVTTHYRVYVAQGRHRQPRQGATWIEPYPQSDAEVQPNTTITPYAPPQLAYTQNGQAQVATFMFWSATDGVDGQTSTNPALNQTVGGAPLTLTAWYLPPGGIGPGGGPGFLDDAFSDALGDFVDDTFVTCTTDGSLTNEANVVGDISTVHAETLEAAAGIHTGESFEHWIAVAEPGQQQPSINGSDVALAQNTSGVAIAAYHKAHIPLPRGANAQEGLVLIGAIAVDGGGYAYPIGHPGGGGPVGPWGPYIARAAKAAALGQLSQGIKGAAEVQRIAANEALQAAEQLSKEVER